jgi:YbbR domain-containing protein
MTGLLARLFEHWQLKLLSVAFAVGLWMFVASEEQSDQRYTVPIEIGSVPAGLAVKTRGADTAEVRVRGRRSILARVRESDVRARLNLADLPPGEASVPLLPEHVTAPRGISVVGVTPARVRVTLGALGQ